MNEIIEDVLIEYVKEQYLDRNKNAENVIREFCSNQPPLSITLYRGHHKTPVIKPGLWYSATTDINVAINEFAGEHCCVFIIHLLEVPCIDINSLIGDKIGDKQEEKEILFLGGGTFYKNNKQTEEGFLEVEIDECEKRTFECWYSLSKSQNSTQPNNLTAVEHALNIIDPEEYEFINSVDDIFLDNEFVISNEEKQQVLDEIRKRKAKAKGGKKRTKHNKKRKRKTTLKKRCKKKDIKRK